MAKKHKPIRPLILAYCCNYCGYAGADLAGVSRIEYEPNVVIVRVPCSGRIGPEHIIEALKEGYDGVLVVGCHYGDCHFISGNYVSKRRFTLIKSILTSLGVEEERVRFEHISAAEGRRFAEVVNEMTRKLRELGPSPFVR